MSLREGLALGVEGSGVLSFALSLSSGGESLCVCANGTQ